MERSIEEVLAEAWAGLSRVTPAQAAASAADGALLVDIRPLEQRRRQGDLPGAVVVGLTVLEWRLAPSSDHRLPEAATDARVIVICGHGYSSSLAAASLRRLGLDATDVIGGVDAWIAGRLPVQTCAGLSDEERRGFDAR